MAYDVYQIEQALQTERPWEGKIRIPGTITRSTTMNTTTSTHDDAAPVVSLVPEPTVRDTHSYSASQSHVVSVPAVRGHQGESVYYTANFPMGMVVKMFTFDPEKMAGLPVEERHQRALQRNRIPEIANYVLHEDYIFSSITVSVDTEGLEFVPSEQDDSIGILRLPLESDWIINDGQHRVAGIALALTKNHDLRHDTLSVMVLPDEGLERSQQVFSDLNRSAVKTSKSLDILYDKRSPVNRIANAIVEAVPLFMGRTDKERAALSARSPNFATLATVQAATAAMFGHMPDEALEVNYDEAEQLAKDFWQCVTMLVKPWQRIADGTLDPLQARDEFISSYAITLTALGGIASLAFQTDDWEDILKPLAKIDFRKSNKEWQDHGMQGTDVIARATTRKAMLDHLRAKLGLVAPEPLPEGDEEPPVRKGRKVTRRGPAAT